ncbi:helix-turn-helix protein [Mesorhizobium sp. J18]|nr:helix-turn-helix protein [Mesorhizobium sp. J18]
MTSWIKPLLSILFAVPWVAEGPTGWGINRRVHVLLRREGWAINRKKTYRLYKELGMQLRNKTPKRRVKAKLREDRAEAVGPNDVWAMDFVHDQLATGRKIRVLTVVDTFDWGDAHIGLYGKPRGHDPRDNS